MTKIGVVGYSSGKFNVIYAEKLVNNGLDHFVGKRRSKAKLQIVSGLTNIGIPALAYKYAKTHDIITVGIACSRAEEYDCYPVDKKIIIGEEWGDESKTFLNYINCLLRVGGGEQSLREAQQFREMYPNGKIVEYPLEREK